MFNDLTSPMTLLATRRSGKARDLAAPGPDPTQLDAILAAATRVPDHGKLNPWRFVTIADDARAAFGERLAAALVAENANAGEAGRAATLAFAVQAPTLVVALSAPVQPSSIPTWEQELSAGSAIMQLMNAATAHGFAANWLTGWAAYSPMVHAAVAEAGERIAGFIFIGTPTRALEERPRPALTDVVRVWRG